MRQRVWLVWAVLYAGPAWAQVSGSVAVVSDYRYRGASLSDGDPAAQLAVAWDGEGWYAGALLSQVHVAGDHGIQALPYLGYARTLRPGLAAEAGVQYAWFSGLQEYRYAEGYVGLSGEHLHARLFRAPDYYGMGGAWYVELGGSRPLGDRLRLVGHVGALRSREGRAAESGWRSDAAVGLGAALPHAVDLQLTWTVGGSEGSGTYCAPWDCGARQAWVLRLAKGW